MLGEDKKCIIKLRLLIAVISFLLFGQGLQAQLVADFNTNRSSGCIPLIVVFNNTSTGNIQSCNWNFGNGNQSTDCNPVATYNTPGTYRVVLTVSDGNGTSVVERVITVFPSPTPDFASDVSGGCLPLQVQFNNQTVSNGAPVVNYVWDFGDGRSSTQNNPTNTYLGENSYNVTLIATDANGCRGSVTKSNFITATNTPRIDFQNDNAVGCRLPVNVNFLAQVQSNFPVSYQWNLGNGQLADAAAPTAAYADTGFYRIRLSVTNSFGCGATAEKDIQVRIEPFIPQIITNANSGCQPFILSFNATGNLPVNAASWNFGNGQVSQAVSGTVTYPLPGTYTVRGVFSNNQGCSEQVERTIEVFPKPMARFSATPTEGCTPPLDVQFTSESPGATAHQWQFGDGGSSILANPLKTYNSSRTYDVRYIATNAFGCRDTLLQRNFIRIQQPSIEIVTGNPSGCVPFSTNFQLIKDGPGVISQVLWNFGNGNTFSGINPPTQVYNTIGIFPVSATVRFSDGCKDTVVSTTVSAGNLPVFSGAFAPQTVCVKSPAVLANASGGDANTFFTWYWGDGRSSEGRNATYEYSDPGVFPITLVGSNFGCKDSIFINNVQVNVPMAAFRIVGACGGLSVDFRNNSIGASTSEWDFGDGTLLASNNVNIRHTFPGLGTYRVKLKVTNSATGCVDSTFQDVVIDNLKQAPVIPVQIGCIPFNVNINISSAAFRTITWDTGDEIITGQNFSKLYDSAGQYSLRVYTLDTLGCRDTFQYTNIIRAVEIQPDFDFSPAGGCAPIEVRFNDRSTSAFTSITSRNWDFNGLGNSTLTNPVFTFLSNDSMNVRLLVRDNIGCTGLVTKKIPVLKPVADFTAEFNSICTNVAFRFDNLSTGVELRYEWDFGHGNEISTDTHPSTFYTELGVYDVKLIITDANNCKDSITKKAFVTVENFDYDFDASPRFKSCPELLTNFEIFPSDILYRNAFWDFGNGNLSLDSSRFPTNIYVESGLFDVSLILEDYRGCKDTIVKKEYIEVRGPRGSFSISPQGGCVPLEVVFEGTFVNSQVNFWDFGDGKGFFDQNLNSTVTHTYTDTGIATPSLVLDDGLGCVLVISGNEILISGAVANILSDQTGICSGAEIEFSDASTAQDFAPLAFRQWYIDGLPVSSDSVFKAAFTAEGVPEEYWVVLEVQTEFGCRDFDSIPVKAYHFPEIIAADDVVICAGDEAVLSAIGAQFYEWSPRSLIAQPTNSRPAVSPLESTWFYVTGYDTIACPGFDSMLVTVVNRFEADAGPDTAVCLGQSVMLFAEVGNINSGNFEFRWTPDEFISDASSPTPLVTPERDMTYQVNIRNGNCEEVNFPVFISVRPSPFVNAGPDQTIFRGQSVTLSASGTQGLGYQWSPNYEISCIDCPFPKVSPKTDTTYFVRVVNELGCAANDSVSVRVYEGCSGENVWLPNTFSPNNDGVNDVFFVRGTALSNISTFRVFNRWGEMIFESPDISLGWDGTHNGVPVNSGVYVYYVEAVCLNGQSTLIQGNVTLLR